ncbi:PHP domain-containing protein [Orenia marismortui]|uniref:PHP domain-containing protein n=1 Tax=Orenia marismortui TaxID=46469 RepID=UPI00036A82CC|nr:hypothetical protein [Orenia marismortui]
MLEKNKLSSFFNSFLQKKNKSYIDLHIHTNASDGIIDLQFLKNFLSNTPHLISITDHNEIRSNVKLYEAGFNTIPAIEVGCQDGFEFLIYFNKLEELEKFYTNSVEPFKNKNKITRTNKDHTFYLHEARKYNSFISIPHIAGLAQKNYLKNKSYIHNITTQVDAIETYNHTLSKKRNAIARKVRKTKNKYATFGSDAHIKREITSFYNYQNSKFTKALYLKKNFYNLCSIIALFGKHLHHFLDLH